MKRRRQAGGKRRIRGGHGTPEALDTARRPTDTDPIPLRRNARSVPRERIRRRARETRAVPRLETERYTRIGGTPSRPAPSVDTQLAAEVASLRSTESLCPASLFVRTSASPPAWRAMVVSPQQPALVRSICTAPFRDIARASAYRVCARRREYNSQTPTRNPRLSQALSSNRSSLRVRRFVRVDHRQPRSPNMTHQTIVTW